MSFGNSSFGAGTAKRKSEIILLKTIYLDSNLQIFYILAGFSFGGKFEFFI